MELQRDLGDSKFTWTEVVTGITGTRTDLARGLTGEVVSYSAQEVAWKDGTITLAQSSANTGMTTTASIYVSSDGAGVGIYTSINGVVSAIAVV
jgi:hypothetical protein